MKCFWPLKGGGISTLISFRLGASLNAFFPPISFLPPIFCLRQFSFSPIKTYFSNVYRFVFIKNCLQTIVKKVKKPVKIISLQKIPCKESFFGAKQVLKKSTWGEIAFCKIWLTCSKGPRQNICLKFFCAPSLNYEDVLWNPGRGKLCKNKSLRQVHLFWNAHFKKCFPPFFLGAKPVSFFSYGSQVFLQFSARRKSQGENTLLPLIAMVNFDSAFPPESAFETLLHF